MSVWAFVIPYDFLRGVEMDKHEDCIDRCQIAEHKGYRKCADASGECEALKAVEVQALPKCPKCGAEDSMEHHRVRFPDAPLDADWDECVVCNHKTDPE